MWLWKHFYSRATFYHLSENRHRVGYLSLLLHNKHNIYISDKIYISVLSVYLKAGLFSLQQCLYFYYRRHSPFWFTWNGLLVFLKKLKKTKTASYSSMRPIWSYSSSHLLFFTFINSALDHRAAWCLINYDLGKTTV